MSRTLPEGSSDFFFFSLGKPLLRGRRSGPLPNLVWSGPAPHHLVWFSLFSRFSAFLPPLPSPKKENETEEKRYIIIILLVFVLLVGGLLAALEAAYGSLDEKTIAPTFLVEKSYVIHVLS